MTTLSVPIPAELEIQMDRLIAWGVADNRASLTRRALQKFAEDEVVARIVAASKEQTLYGDLDTLAASL